MSSETSQSLKLCIIFSNGLVGCSERINVSKMYKDRMSRMSKMSKMYKNRMSSMPTNWLFETLYTLHFWDNIKYKDWSLKK